MPLTTNISLSGFIASTPQSTRLDDGTTRTYMRVGQEHYTRNQDGSFTQEESTFHDLVLFRGTAKKAAAQFRKGDRFIAEGYPHTYQVTNQEGQQVQREEFVARRIGHDLAYTSYEVDRSPKVRQTPSSQIENELRPAEAALLIGMGA